MTALSSIESLDKWLDESELPEPYRSQPGMQDWARISKIAEELGEAIQAFIGATGQNPRKGITHDMDDVLEEIADVIITGYCAIQHFTKNSIQTHKIVDNRLSTLLKRIGLPNQHDLGLNAP